MEKEEQNNHISIASIEEKDKKVIEIKEIKEVIKLPKLRDREDIVNDENEIEANRNENKEEKNLLNKKRERDNFEKKNEEKDYDEEEEDEKTEKNKINKKDIKENEKQIEIKEKNNTNNNITLIEQEKTVTKKEDKKEEEEEKKSELTEIKEEKKELKIEEKNGIKIEGKNEIKIKEEKKETKEAIYLNNNDNQKIIPENIAHNSPKIQEKNKTSEGNDGSKKRITFKEAQRSIKEFMEFMNKTEEKIKKKYGNCLPDFSCEEQLPFSWRTKLINKFFESEEMKNIEQKMKDEQSEKK